VRGEESRLVLSGPGSGPVDAFSDRLQQLDTEAQSLESRISERSQSYRTAHSEVTIDAVQRALPAGTVLVEYVVYRPFDPKEKRRDAKFLPPRCRLQCCRRRGPCRLTSAPDAVNTAVDVLGGRFVIAISVRQRPAAPTSVARQRTLLPPVTSSLRDASLNLRRRFAVPRSRRRTCVGGG
jgi:hypothetical protein